MSAEPTLQTLRARIDFLGEQDGEPERELKEALARVLESMGNVNRAYLARLFYSNTRGVGVGLCVASETESPELVQAVRSEFEKLFSRDQYLDVLFVREPDEEKLKQVCRPFFCRPGPN
jgi:type III secretion system (T3SS) SseB-like protein